MNGRNYFLWNGNQMTIPWRSILHRLPMLVMAALVLTGCASVFRDLDEHMQRTEFRADYDILDQAITVYRDGNFHTAMERFQALASTSRSTDVRRKARLGEICSRLMLACTAEAYSRAVGMWHDFRASVTARDNVWDPILLEPLIVREVPATQAVTEPSEQKTNNDDAVPVKHRMTRRAAAASPPERMNKNELTILKKNAERAETLERQLESVIAENKSLKEKIKALEAIDQNIQKKKTAIAEPGE